MAARARVGVVLLLAVGLLAAPAGTALAEQVTVSSPQRVLGHLDEAELEVDLGDGAVARGHLLRFPLDDPDLDLRPHLAGDVAAGLDRMPALARRHHGDGAVAGTNGGYWLDRPAGVPNGLHVRSGRLVAGQAATRSGHDVSRAAVGLSADRGAVMDRVDVALHLRRPDGTVHSIEEINRRPRLSGRYPRPVAGELLVYTPRYGAPVDVPDGALALVTDDLAVGSSGRVEAAVRQVISGPARHQVSSGQTLLVAHGSRRDTLAGVSTGDAVSVSTQVQPSGTDAARWQQLDHAVAGGPLLLRDGRTPSNEQMRAEAFGRSHVIDRHPRTAVARTGDGDMLLVTIDGRRSGWSAGVTLRQLVGLLRELGAVDAVNLDGGGSTTAVVDGQVRNRPSESGRSVTDGLFVHAPLPPSSRDIATHACPGDTAPSGQFADAGGSVHSAAIDCLGWWGVTEGAGGDAYAPRAVVRRDQMASFLARWIDSASERGLTARPLPPVALEQFSDVPGDSVHAEAINRLATVGIVEGRSADRYAPRDAVTRAQMASLVRRAHEWIAGGSLPGFRDTFTDDNGSVHEAAIDRLAGVGVIGGTGGFAYAPGDGVRRDAMASFLMRGADHLVEAEVTRPPPTSEPAEPAPPPGDVLDRLDDVIDEVVDLLEP